jgi:cell division protein ZapE
MSPLQLYREQLQRGRLMPDEAQAAAVQSFDTLYRALTARSARSGLWGRLRGRAAPPVKGLYLWGGVGRGKTWMMDLFFDSLPAGAGRREHFHRFMGRVHGELEQFRGRRDPLPQVAGAIVAETRVLCLDEFQVWDIADAMILSGLLKALFAQGVTLVATSNTAPVELYRDGLQRPLFLPAIDRIEANMRVLELADGVDYRRRYLEQAETYHTPLGERSEALLAEAFERIAPNPGRGPLEIDVNGRPVGLKRLADSVAWADFGELCDTPRGQADYLELARCHHSLILSGIPQMDDGQNDQARRFIHLVDVLYDRNVTLLASAATQPEALYTGERLAFEFRRTASRLLEMQSRQWLERPHLA